LRGGNPFVISYLTRWRTSYVPAAFTRRLEITSEKLAITCAELASNKKAEDIIVLDLRDISTFTDFFVICSATSEPHLKAIAGEIETRLKEDHRISAAAVDGFPASQWIVLDYLQVVVHVFHQDKREFYSLESLWGDAPQIDWESAKAAISSAR
jgi:ribosome-associated protein